VGQCDIKLAGVLQHGPRGEEDCRNNSIKVKSNQKGGSGGRVDEGGPGGLVSNYSHRAKSETFVEE